jgi:CheY-like chemotaxis protein
MDRDHVDPADGASRPRSRGAAAHRDPEPRGQRAAHLREGARHSSSSWMKADRGSGLRAKTTIILFVEDDSDVRALYGGAMREAGFFVDEVVSVSEAVAIAGRLKPDLVVLDRDLVDGDGWDVARALRADPETRATPIVAFTAHQTRGDLESALVAGCDAYLVKPCAPDTLVRHVHGMLGLPLDGSRGGDAPKSAAGS